MKLDFKRRLQLKEEARKMEMDDNGFEKDMVQHSSEDNALKEDNDMGESQKELTEEQLA